MEISFFLPMIPPTVTAQQHKVNARGKVPRFYDPPELADARAKLTAHLNKHAPAAPLAGSLRLCVKWCFPICGRHKHGEYKATRPDTDNLEKLLKDCMTRVGFWADDAQVASEIVEKFYSAMPGIYIRVETL